jgi:CubicO group peptidase (beta-lactamase class C family)
MRDRFFRPLGMRTASYCPTRTTDSVFATGYDRRGQQTVPAQPISMSSPYAAGALCMAVTDFLTWQHALTGGRVVRRRPTRAWRRPTRSPEAGRCATVGARPDTLAGRRVVQHGGDIPGGSAQQLWFPDDSLRVIVFSNTLGSIPNRLAGNLARAVLGAPLVREPRALVGVPLPPERRASSWAPTS